MVLWTYVPATTTTPINGRNYDLGGVPFEIPGQPTADSGGAAYLHEMRLRTAHPELLIQHPQLALVFGDYLTSPRLRDAELLFAGTGCVYRTRSGATLRNDARLTFIRRNSCLQGPRAATGEIVLRIWFSTPGHVAIWTVARAPVDVPEDGIVVTRSADRVYVARGMVTDVFPDQGDTRLALLGYVWNLSRSAWWIVFAITAIAILAGAGTALLWFGPDASASRRPAGAFAVALALASAYAVIVPPFQAADEPNHLVGLSDLLQRPSLAAEAGALAERDHFEEIQFDGDRKFSALDRNQGGIPWNDGAPPENARGTGAHAFWKLFVPRLRGLPVPQLLMAIRLVHCVLFAASVALFVWLTGRAASVRHSELLMVPLLLVPSLPYFGSYVSNYAPLLSVYIVFAAGAAIALWNARSIVAGFVFMSALACAVAISRSALPMLPLAVALLLARVTMGGDGRWRPAALYWLGVMPGAFGIAAALRSAMPGRVPAGIFVIALAGTLAGAAAEIAIGRIRASGRFTRDTGSATRIIAIAAACTIGVILAASVTVRYPSLPVLVPWSPPPAMRYVLDAMAACGTFLRMGRPDTLSSETFWVGFGWLEARPPWVLVSLLATVSSISLVGLLIWIAMARSGTTLAMFSWIVLGFFLSIAAYALGVVRMGIFDLHGRYLLGAYLTILVVAWSGAARLAGVLPPVPRGRLRASVAAACLGVHAYCLCYLLGRYF